MNYGQNIPFEIPTRLTFAENVNLLNNNPLTSFNFYGEYPASLALMWDSSVWANSIVGTDLGWSYAGEQYVDGVSVGLNPPITDNGLGCYPAYTNDLPSGAEDFSSWYSTADKITVLGDEIVLLNPVHFLRITVSVESSADMLFSFKAKSGTATDLRYSIYDLTNYGDIVGTTSYYEETNAETYTTISVKFTVPATCISVGLYVLRDSGSTGTCYLKDPQLTQSQYLLPYIPTGTSVTSSVGTVAGNGAYFEMDEATLVAFGGKGGNPATLTLATVATMGVGSDEIGEAWFNIVSSSDSYVKPSYYGSEAGVTKVVGGYDGGLGIPQITDTWNRNDRIVRIIQTDETGANFRVGYKNITQGDTEYTFSSWVVFDGSFDPLDYLRFAMDSTVPIEIGHVQVHKSYVDTSVVDKELAKYGWV